MDINNVFLRENLHCFFRLQIIFLHIFKANKSYFRGSGRELTLVMGTVTALTIFYV